MLNLVSYGLSGGLTGTWKSKASRLPALLAVVIYLMIPKPLSAEDLHLDHHMLEESTAIQLAATEDPPPAPNLLAQIPSETSARTSKPWDSAKGIYFRISGLLVFEEDKRLHSNTDNIATRNANSDLGGGVSVAGGMKLGSNFRAEVEYTHMSSRGSLLCCTIIE